MNTNKQNRYLQIQNWMKIAADQKQAIPAFNFDSWEIAKGISHAALEAKYPVFLMSTESAAKNMGIEYVVALIKVLQKNNPWIISHWDHGFNYDLTIQAIANGYDSVMYDGSMLPFEDNIERSLNFVEKAKQNFVISECEIGKIGGKEDDINLKEQPLTSIDEFIKFSNLIKADMLGAAIGTTHGYNQFSVNIHFENIKKFSQLVKPYYFVLHGGTGVSKKDLAKSILSGVIKINIGTQLKKTALNCMAQFCKLTPIDYDLKKLHKQIILNVKNEVLEVIELCKNPKNY